jgi:uncharacterized RDD family membrane protein YckC
MSERVLDVVDPDVVLEHVDINALLDRVDVNALLDRVEVNTLLDRVDINALLDRADVDELMKRADIDALMARVDVKALVDRAGIPEIVAESTSHLTGSALDLFRKPIVGLDEITVRGLNRLFRRDTSQYPPGPEKLVSWVDERTEDQAAIRTGRYAGPVTRLIALVIDAFIVSTGFTLILAGATFIFERVTNSEVDLSGRGLWFAVAVSIWAFLYMWLSLAVFGKTLGKTVMGLRVVAADGSVSLRSGQAAVRVLTYPLSFIFLGIGLLGIVFGRERRAWHDHFAGTAVVYDWGSRTARLSTPLAAWLERKGVSG